ncbi:MAG: protease Do [Saprospirales bacterium]|nr:protease Do [Saprospirales bacterium]
MKRVLPLIFTSLLSAFLAVAIYKYVEPPCGLAVTDSNGQPVYTRYGDDILFSGDFQRTFLSSEPTDFTSAAERVTTAVVNIRAMESGSYRLWGSGGVGSSSGSGVIISPDGYIVTNNHVIEGGNRYEVTLNDHREYNAKLIATDPSTDLALIKVDADNLPFLVFGNSDSLRVGEWVMAVGNPFNLVSTVTAGIVSAKGRSIDILEGDYTIESFIQTDAAVNPGNSGGALVNTNGELVGINTAIITRSGRYEGYSFAIPSNLAQKVIYDLKEFGSVRRGLLGVKIGPVDTRIAEELDLPAIEGVFVSSVVPGGGAYEAGLKAGDVIIGVNEVKVKSIPELQEQIGRLHPGDKVEVHFIRNGEQMTIKVTLRDENHRTGFVLAEDTDVLERHGFDLRELTVIEKRRLRTRGVFVDKIIKGSIIASTAMDPGYIITKINDTSVNSVAEVVELLKKNKNKEVILEGFYEDYPGEYYYTFRVK